MRILLAAVAAALLLSTAPLAAQQAAEPPGSDPWEVRPTSDLIGKTVMHRYENKPVGTIRSIAMGDDGKPKMAVRLADSGRTVLLGSADVERRGERIQLMMEPEHLAGLPDYTGAAATGSSQ